MSDHSVFIDKYQVRPDNRFMEYVYQKPIQSPARGPLKFMGVDQDEPPTPFRYEELMDVEIRTHGNDDHRDRMSVWLIHNHYTLAKQDTMVHEVIVLLREFNPERFRRELLRETFRSKTPA